jgi:hypothetical protein
LLDAIVRLQSHDEIRGRVLDSSEGGMAVALFGGAQLPPVGTSVEVSIIIDSLSSSKPVGNATIKRNWAEEGFLDEGKGVALQYIDQLPENDIRKILLRGIRQKTRLESQRELAMADMSYLGNYRRDLIDCQTKLFLLSLTIGVTLAGAYFGLIYHSVASKELNNASLSFWRTMIAALPGCFFMACALMVAQKAITIQRIDAYVATLKECYVLQRFPREYRGWETGYWRFRRILKSVKCDTCEVEKKCGDIEAEEWRTTASRSMFRNPTVDFYHVIVYASFFLILGFSTIAVLTELIQYQWGVYSYMAATFLFTIVVASTVAYLWVVFFHLRKGRYSSDYFRQRWLNLLNRCRHQ